MSERNYWTRIRRTQLSRRAVLRASARAGVGAAGLALVGCGSSDDQQEAQPAPAASAAPAQQQQQQDQPAPAARQQQEQQAEQQAQQVQQQEEQAGAADTDAMQTEEDQTAAEPQVDLDATLRAGINRDAGGLDPQRSGSQTNYISASSCFDSGMSNHPDTAALLPNLVGAIEIVDPTNLIFQVSDGIFFHDGTPYTAEDLQFNFERVSSAAAYHDGGESSDHPSGWNSARQTFGTQNFSSWSVVDSLNMAVELPAPDASLAGSIMSGAVRHMSKRFVEENGDAFVDLNPMGTGPYRFISHADDTDFIFTRYDEYHRAREANVSPHRSWVRDLEVYVRPEPLARIAGIEAGELDLAFDMPTDVVEPYRDNPDFKVLYGPAGNPNQYLMPNTHLAEWNGEPNPFLDIRVREAANLAINRDAIINGLLTGQEKPSYGPYAGTIGYPRDALESRYHGYDPERAKALLAEAGYADGLDIDLHIVTDFQTFIPPMALVIQQDLEAIGIRTTIKEYLSSEYFVMVRTFENPGLFWFFTNTIAEPETVNGSGINEDGFYAVSVYPDTEIQELYLAQKQALDPDERAGVLERLYTTFYDNYSWVFLTEVYAAAITSAQINWPVGAAETRGTGTLTKVQKLRSA